MPTVAQTVSWIGRELIDPEGTTIGTITEVYRDRQTGAAEWLLVEVAAERKTDRHTTLVPVAGASQVGRAVTVPRGAQQVLDAPSVPAAANGDDLDPADERRLTEHYGLLYDTEHSGTGLPVEPQFVEHRRPEPRHARPMAGTSSHVIDLLRDLHAVEQGLVTQLTELQSRVPDDEIAHDLHGHLIETQRHEQAVQERLEAIGATRSILADAVALVGSKLGGKASAIVRSDPVLDVRDAFALEHLEVALYTTLELVAERTGDERTAQLARAHREDELAMAERIGASWVDLAEICTTDVPALLRGALVLERSVLGRLEALATGPLAEPAREHREVTARHVERVQARLSALGTGTGGGASDAAGRAIEAIAGLVRREDPLRAAREAFVAEHEEIATYELLERVALGAGDLETAALAAEIRAEEQAMAALIGSQWSAVVTASGV